jgi:hypothetical protein
MSPYYYRDDDRHRTIGRRSFLRGVGAAGSVGTLGIGTVAATPDSKRTPTP